MFFLRSILFLVLAASNFATASQLTYLKRENQSISNYSAHMVSFYQLGQGEKWRDVTAQVLASADTSHEAKHSIYNHHRRLIVFEYPSDHLLIKGFISFTPHPEHHPLLLLYRWGNQKFALMNPGDDLSTYEEYTVVSSTLRGGVSQGKDEFGGQDVDDMKNLISFLPQLARELHIQLPTCMSMLGPSRGGLEMFLTLARYPELQNRVKNVVALSSILDLHTQIQDRPGDMKVSFEKSFGLPKDFAGEEAWIHKRDPLATIPYLKKSLPILIIQGTNDPRINLVEGHHMVQALEESGHRVNYWEVQGGNHTLSNVPHEMDRIAHWLEMTQNTLGCKETSKRAQVKGEQNR